MAAAAKAAKPARARPPPPPELTEHDAVLRFERSLAAHDAAASAVAAAVAAAGEQALQNELQAQVEAELPRQLVEGLVAAVTDLSFPRDCGEVDEDGNYSVAAVQLWGGSWTCEEEPAPCAPDPWARGVVPVLQPSQRAAHRDLHPALRTAAAAAVAAASIDASAARRVSIRFDAVSKASRGTPHSRAVEPAKTAAAAAAAAAAAPAPFRVPPLDDVARSEEAAIRTQELKRLDAAKKALQRQEAEAQRRRDEAAALDKLQQSRQRDALREMAYAEDGTTFELTPVRPEALPPASDVPEVALREAAAAAPPSAGGRGRAGARVVAATVGARGVVPPRSSAPKPPPKPAVGVGQGFTWRPGGPTAERAAPAQKSLLDAIKLAPGVSVSPQPARAAR